MPFTDSGEKDTEIVVNFRNGAHGATWIGSPGLLFDADRGRKARYVVDVGLGELTHELPGIRRKRFDVTALTLGIKRVKGERAFARAGDAGETNEFVLGEDEIDFAQVVFSGPTDDDLAHIIAHAVISSPSVGRLMKNVVPSPGVDSKPIVPPCISTNFLTMANPRPRPRLQNP